MITIKLINYLSSLFKTNLTVINQKARDDNKLSNLQTFLSNLENKEYHIK